MRTVKREISAPPINAECDQIIRSANNKSSTYAAQTFKSSKHINNPYEPCDKGCLKIGLVYADIPVKVNSNILIYFDDCKGYVHILVSEICDGIWHRNRTICDWETDLVDNFL